MPVSKKRKSAKSIPARQRLENRLTANAMRRHAHDVKRNTLPFSHPMNLFALDMVFGPIEAIIASMQESGDVYVHQGDPVFFHEADGVWYPIIPTFHEMCNTFEIASASSGAEAQTEGVRGLIRKLHYCMPIDERDTAAALESVRWMREFTMPLTPAQMSGYMRTTQIKAELAARGLTKH
jgi:hypothetical protein